MAVDTEELTALVLSFLTQSLKDNPSGFELGQFERIFPERTEEPADWYKRYNAKNPLEALKLVDQNSIKVHTNHNGLIFVSLNKYSDKVDQHLVDLVVNQKSSSKRRRAPARAQSQRCLDSFAINKGYSRGYNNSRSTNSFKSRLNYDNSTQRSHHQFVEKRPTPLSTPRQTIYKEQPIRAAPGDPRAKRQQSAQVRPTPSLSGFGPPPPPPSKQQSTTAFNTAQARRSSSSSSPYSSSRISSTKLSVQEALRSCESRSSQQHQQATTLRPVDPELEERRSKVKQRLLHLLTQKYVEIKTLYVRNLYEAEFEEVLDPIPLGYKTLTQLYESFNDKIKIDYKGSMPTLRVINIIDSNGKENVASAGGNNNNTNNNCPGNHTDSGIASSIHNTSPSSSNLSSDNKENKQSGRARFKAIDPFNVTTMLQSLEPLRQVKEPPLGNNKLEDIVKYRTMRVIFKSPELKLRLDDWERKYQQEWNCSNKIQIRDYGFKTLLEFFKHLALELPIKIRLKDDQWVAELENFKTLSEWLRDQVASGQYRAVTVIDAKYEHIAYPGDKYSYLDYKSLQRQSFYPSVMMAVRSAHKMWLQMGDTLERAEDNISFETTSTCYDDYKRKGFFTIPDNNFIKAGFPCAAFDESEQRWCRAIIVESPESINDNTFISAHLVDYATTKHFKRPNLLCILKNHIKQPVGNNLQSTIND